MAKKLPVKRCILDILVVIDILIVLEGILVADLAEMTAVVPRIDHNNANVALHVKQAYLAVVYLGLTVATAAFFCYKDYCYRNVSRNQKNNLNIKHLLLNGYAYQYSIYDVVI